MVRQKRPVDKGGGRTEAGLVTGNGGGARMEGASSRTGRLLLLLVLVGTWRSSSELAKEEAE